MPAQDAVFTVDRTQQNLRPIRLDGLTSRTWWDPLEPYHFQVPVRLLLFSISFLSLSASGGGGRSRAESGGCSGGELPGQSGDDLPRTSSRWRWRRRLGAELSGRGARQPSRSERRGCLGAERRRGCGAGRNGGPALGRSSDGEAAGRRDAAGPAARNRGAGIFFSFFLFDKKN